MTIDLSKLAASRSCLAVTLDRVNVVSCKSQDCFYITHTFQTRYGTKRVGYETSGPTATCDPVVHPSGLLSIKNVNYIKNNGFKYFLKNGSGQSEQFLSLNTNFEPRVVWVASRRLTSQLCPCMLNLFITTTYMEYRFLVFLGNPFKFFL